MGLLDYTTIFVLSLCFGAFIGLLVAEYLEYRDRKKSAFEQIKQGLEEAIAECEKGNVLPLRRRRVKK